MSSMIQTERSLYIRWATPALFLPAVLILVGIHHYRKNMLPIEKGTNFRGTPKYLKLETPVIKLALQEEGIYSARSIEAGSIRTAWSIGRNAASSAPARIASAGIASICRSVAFTW